MKKRDFVWKAAAVAMLLLPLSPASAAHARAPNDALRGVDAASRAFDDAQFRGDVVALERFLASDFLYVRGSGQVAGRREFIANFTGPEQYLDPFVITDRRVVALGRDAAVVAAVGVISGTNAGKPFREHFRFADTFVRRSGSWRVAYVQVTPVAS